MGSYLAEPRPDGSTQDAEDELAVLGLDEGIVERCDETEVVRRKSRGRRCGFSQTVGDVEWRPRRVRRPEIRVQAVAGQPAFPRLWNELVCLSVEIEEASGVVVVKE